MAQFGSMPSHSGGHFRSFKTQAATTEELNSHTKMLYNGAVGINFHELAAPNLAQSAVLRMLEEEEGKVGGEPRSPQSSPFCRRRNNRAWPPTPPASPPTRRRLEGNRASPVAWPPTQPRVTEPPTVPIPHSTELPFANQSNSTRARSFSPAGIKRVAWPPPAPEQTFCAAAIEQQQRALPNPQGDLEAYPPATLLYSPPPPEAAMEASTCVFTLPSAPTPPPPATITLRPAAPVSQPPPPVVRSEPALPEAAFASAKRASPVANGSGLRGDTKWPPSSWKQLKEAEKAQQAEIARGPACRPRRPQKDYSSFFEQHRLTPTYTHYRAPPGTQHYPTE